MLGRAVQLTFPTSSPGEGSIKDSCTSQHYLDMCLQHPSGHEHDLDLSEIRQLNRKGQYLWGDYLDKIPMNPPPTLRLLNLETAVTKTINNPDVPFYKGINYHFHVDNLESALSAFQQTAHGSTSSPSPVVVSMANNHCLDYGRTAFDRETLPQLESLNHIAQFVGCGCNITGAQAPVIVDDIQVFASAAKCSGTPEDWFADTKRSGLWGLPSIRDQESANEAIDKILKPVLTSAPRTGLRILSIHMGPNWAYKQETATQVAARRLLAHRLIDECGVDLIYGHSSHHCRGMEVYKNKLILYGTGDMINDYEGFENIGEEKYIKLGGLYVVDYVDDRFLQLRIVPMYMNRLRCERWTADSKIWKPRSRELVSQPTLIFQFCEFLNKLSDKDAGGRQAALEMEQVDFDHSIPGGPILRSKKHGSA